MPRKGSSRFLENSSLLFSLYNNSKTLLAIIVTPPQTACIMESMKRSWRVNDPTYDRTWLEIEDLLYRAEIEMNSQRAKGIVDTLRWTLGERNQKSPLDEGLGN